MKSQSNLRPEEDLRYPCSGTRFRNVLGELIRGLSQQGQWRRLKGLMMSRLQRNDEPLRTVQSRLSSIWKPRVPSRDE